ncbi:molybdopterin-dependent oxidoreductase [Thermoleophilia bacterium SCSIO 60948]|nr:molybdopterin-dependent oxidoreductase [Thermoleophilia bacterium SCSIO 60948]
MGTSFGRGGATTFQQDLQNSDCILIQGSNMAECHPVGFQWVMEAKERGAKIIHVDPRFTRTSAVSDLHVPIRAGTDIAFLGGIVNYVLEGGHEFTEYVRAYTNADVIIDEGFADTEDLDGLFSGWDPETGEYDQTSWRYEGESPAAAAGQRQREGGAGHSAGGPLETGKGVSRDPSLEDPRCVWQILKRHFSRYTPEMVERVTGVPAASMIEVAEALVANSGRERTSAFCYAVGWTQHSVGVQYIRTASILQLLLGNIGRPGGGILALRGHASIQGSTDVPTLFDILPGYIPMPGVESRHGLDEFVEANSADTGFWGEMKSYLVSLQKAWWGDAATAENDWAFDYLPRISGDHSHYQSLVRMREGTTKGYFVVGQNPAVGSANARLNRLAMAELDWMVVRELVDTETSSFWRDSPEIESGELTPETIGTEVFLMPAASHAEKEGTFTNTQRLLQWREKAVDPPGDARSDLWFFFHLGRLVRERLARAGLDRDRPALDLTWDYPTHGEHAEPSAEAVLAEMNGYDAGGEHLASYTGLADDGSTSCGVWIYCGVYADGVNQANRRKPGSEQSWVAPEWGWAWPSNRRILYNRASADPEGRPWSERKALVWWDAEEGRWAGPDIADFEPTKPPDYVAPEGAKGLAAIAGTEPFILQADGRGWLFVPAGLADGPLPTHYEPHESPFENPLYAQQANPAREVIGLPENPYARTGEETGADAYPFVMSTYRLTEHHTAGGMSRFLGRLAELQPEMFCEVSPELAELRGLESGGWATIVTPRSAIEARVIVTERIRTLTVEGRETHQVGLPYHWGNRGEVTGDGANELLSVVMDPNTHIGEYKAATCDLIAGRRPRGPALREFVDAHARKGHVARPGFEGEHPAAQS